MTRRRGQPLSPDDSERVDRLIVEMAAAGASNTVIAAAVGISATGVRYRRRSVAQRRQVQMARREAISKADAAIARELAAGSRIEDMATRLDVTEHMLSLRVPIVRQMLIKAGAIALGFVRATSSDANSAAGVVSATVADQPEQRTYRTRGSATARTLDRRLVRLIEVKGMTVPDAAKRLGINSATATSRLRALGKLTRSPLSLPRDPASREARHAEVKRRVALGETPSQIARSTGLRRSSIVHWLRKRDTPEVAQ